MNQTTSQAPFECISPPKESYNEEPGRDRHLRNADDQIEPGRLCIKCVGTANIRRKDQTQSKTKLNMYICFTLGPNSGIPLQRSTKANGHVTSGTTSLAGDVIKFDVEQPSDFYSSEDNDIKLKIELFDKHSIEKNCLGEITISATRFFVEEKQVSEWIPLIQAGDTSSNSAINLEFTYTPVKEGVLMLTILETKSMVHPENKYR